MVPSPPPHPIVKETMALLKKDGESYELDASAAKKLTASLASLFGKPELVDAVGGVVVLAQALDQKLASPAASKAIMAVAETTIHALRALGNAGEIAANGLQSAADKLKRLGGDRPRTAPKPSGPTGTGGGIRLRKR